MNLSPLTPELPGLFRFESCLTDGGVKLVGYLLGNRIAVPNQFNINGLGLQIVQELCTALQAVLVDLRSTKLQDVRETDKIKVCRDGTLIWMEMYSDYFGVKKLVDLNRDWFYNKPDHLLAAKAVYSALRKIEAEMLAEVMPCPAF
jgi:hypothetical protein